MERWHANIKDWNNVSVSTADLYLQLAEKRLDETVESAKNISDRNDKLLALNITLLTGALGFITSNKWINLFNDFLSTVLFFMSIILATALIYLIKNIFCYRVGTKGEEPAFIIKDNFIDNYDKEEQFLNLVFHMCETYQNKITLNTIINSKRNKRLSIAIYILVSLPTAFFLAAVYHFWM